MGLISQNFILQSLMIIGYMADVKSVIVKFADFLSSARKINLIIKLKN